MEKLADHEEITQAKVEDLMNIITLNQQLHLDKYTFDFKWDRPDWIREEIEKGNFFIFKQNGETVGAINLQSVSPEELYIETLTVQPSKHGSGIGRKLIAHAKDVASRSGCRKLTVESFQAFGLLDFYQKIGFELDDPAIDYFEGEPFYRFIMQLLA